MYNSSNSVSQEKSKTVIGKLQHSIQNQITKSNFVCRNKLNVLSESSSMDVNSKSEKKPNQCAAKNIMGSRNDASSYKKLAADKCSVLFSSGKPWEETM